MAILAYDFAITQKMQKKRRTVKAFIVSPTSSQCNGWEKHLWFFLGEVVVFLYQKFEFEF